MSRLFSRLETKGRDQNEGMQPPLPAEPFAHTDDDAHAHPGAAAAPDFASRAGQAVVPASPQLPLVPGYSIASSLAMTAPPASGLPKSSRTAGSAWPLRLWLLSLLLLLALSLLVLALPEPLLHASRQAPPAQSPAVAAAPGAAALSAAAAVQPAAQPPAPAAPAAAPAPLPSAADARCSEAMRAMSLCGATGTSGISSPSDRTHP